MAPDEIFFDLLLLSRSIIVYSGRKNNKNCDVNKIIVMSSKKDDKKKGGKKDKEKDK